MIIDKVKGTVKKYSMMNPGDRVIVAVSGGPDSVCLLSVLRELAEDLDLTLHIAHLDHMFRGKESADEALFVGQLAKTLGIPATIEKVDVPAYCLERGLSPQEGAREVRYDFLQRVAGTVTASRIATGHTADDQAETFVMRLMRGAGVSGLSAIPPVRDNIIRPLIEITREEVLAYLRATGLSFVTDPSNTKSLYTRNKIRLEIIPVLKSFNPRIVETLAAEAALLRDEDAAIDLHCAELADSILEQQNNDLTIKKNEFSSLPIAFRRRLLKKALDLAGVESSGLSRVQIDEALAFMAGAPTGRTMNLLHGLTIGREYDTFLVRPKSESNKFCFQLVIPGLTAIPEIGVEVETRIQDKPQEPENPPVSPFSKGGASLPPPLAKGGEGGFEELPSLETYLWQALFDYDKIGSFLTLRNRHSGDWFCPAGMGGKRKKLQDYFVDRKVPRRKRDMVPLLCSGEDILWVVGHRTDERFHATVETKKVLVVRVKSAD